MPAQRSIVICGGAFAGLALALALRQGLGADIPVIVADPALATRPSRDPRATAIVAACRRLFEAIGVWDEVAAEAQPILDMVVTDSKLEDATRPVFLTFAGDVEPGEPFAHMVENRHLIDALVARAEAEGIDLRATAVAILRFARRRRRRDARATAASSRRACWSPPTARARNCASAPASPPMAGTTINPASSSPSAMSAIITAAPKSISCPRVRSRSCR